MSKRKNTRAARMSGYTGFELGVFNQASAAGGPQKFSSSDAIDCGNGRTVKVSYADAAFYLKAKKDPSLEGKKGEDYVDALLSLKNTAIDLVAREHHGRKSDGPKGEPGLVFYKHDGMPHQINHYDQGEMTSRHLFHDNHALAGVEFFHKGKPCQAPDGAAGHQSWHPNGKPFAVINYDDKGRKLDEKKFRENGQLSEDLQYEDGALKERRQYSESGRLQTYWKYNPDGSYRVERYNECGNLSDSKFKFVRGTGPVTLPDDAAGPDVSILPAIAECDARNRAVSEQHYRDGAQLEAPHGKKFARIRAAMSRLRLGG